MRLDAACLTMPHLALADLWRERLLFACNLAALSAILAPLLVLDGLRTGIVGALTAELRARPDILRIVIPGNHAFTRQDIEAMRQLPGIGFLEPTSRSIAARTFLEAGGGALERAELLPSRAGDPLLPPDVAPPGPRQIILNDRLAKSLGVTVGDQLTGRNGRGEGQRVLLDLPFEVAGIQSSGILQGRSTLVHPGIIDALEAFLDDFEVPEFGIPGRPLAERHELFENVRLYASSLDDVIPLAEAVSQRFGVRVAAADEEITRLDRLDANLGTVFALIAGIAGSGVLLALSASLVANVERKRHELSVVRLMGASKLELVTFPLAQSVMTALATLLLSIVVFALIAGVINARFADAIGSRGAVCVLEPWRTAAIAMCVLMVAAVAAYAGGAKAARLDPTEGLREA